MDRVRPPHAREPARRGLLGRLLRRPFGRLRRRAAAAPRLLKLRPEAGAFLAELDKAAAREEAANAAEAAGDGAAEDDAAEDEPAEGSAEAAE